MHSYELTSCVHITRISCINNKVKLGAERTGRCCRHKLPLLVWGGRTYRKKTKAITRLGIAEEDVNAMPVPGGTKPNLVIAHAESGNARTSGRLRLKTPRSSLLSTRTLCIPCAQISEIW